MAKGMYATVGGVTKKIKKQYCVVGGVTKKVKKVYAVVGGVTRLVWTGELRPSRYGTASNLSAARHDPLGASTGDYAIFAGGRITYPIKTVDAYNSSLTKNSSIGQLYDYRAQGMAGSIGNFALFAGGITYDGYSERSTLKYVERYDTSLTHNYAGDLSCPRYYGAACNIGNTYLAFYGGGDYDDTYPGENNCEIYNTSLTKETKYLGYALYRFGQGSCNVGNYALFPGGNNYGSIISHVTTLDSSLTYTYNTYSIPTGVCAWAAGHTNDYAILTGGMPAGSYSSTQVVAWNSSLTRFTPAALTTAKTDHACASLKNFVIVGGGFHGGTYVDSYDNSLTKTTLTAASVNHSYCAAATTGNYALIAGGVDSSVVDVYQVA